MPSLTGPFNVSNLMRSRSGLGKTFVVSVRLLIRSQKHENFVLISGRPEIGSVGPWDDGT